MLKALRDGAKSGFMKFILLGLMALAVGGLVLTDVGGFFRGGVSNNLVAKGKGIEISTMQFDRTVRRILSRQGMAPQEAYNLGLITQILNSEVQTLILTREAKNMGLNISDEVVMDQISKIAEPLARDGMSKKDALRQVLNSQGVSEGEFIQSIRQEMGNNLFREALVSGAETISENQASDIYQYQNELRDFEGVIFDDSKASEASVEPTSENLEKYYEANKSEFLISEKRDITLVTLKKEMIADKVQISDEDVKGFYDDHQESYEKPERRKLQQAILDRQVDAQEIVKKVNEGKDLKSSVKTVTGNTSPYLGENIFEEGGLLEEISKPAFESDLNAVIGPVQTPLGWHVLVLKEIIEPQVESFDKVKDSIRNELLQERVLEDLVNAGNSLDDRLASGEELKSVVDDMGLTTEKYSNFNQAGLDANGKDLFVAYQGDRAQLLEASFNFDQGESSPVMELADGRFIVVHVDDVEEKSYTPLVDVKDKLAKKWMVEQKALANKQRAEEAMVAIKSGKSLSEIADQFGLKLEKFKNLKRAQTPPSPITLNSLRDIYEVKPNTPLKLNIENGFLIGQVTKIDLPEVEKADKEIKSVMNDTKQIIPQEVIAQYINNLSEKYKVKINDRVLKQLYGSTE